MNFDGARVYVLTPRDNRLLLEEVTLPYDEEKMKRGVFMDPVLELALEHSANRDEQVDVHAHNQWWSPIYSAYPDGSLYRHATGRKNGWVISPQEAATAAISH